MAIQNKSFLGKKTLPLLCLAWRNHQRHKRGLVKWKMAYFIRPD